MNASQIYKKLQELAPSIHFYASRELDASFVWDGDAPDPAQEGFSPYDVTVCAQAIHRGDLIEGQAYLGGSYFAEDEPMDDLHGYLPQKLEEAAIELGKLLPDNQELTAVLKFLKQEMHDRYDEQMGTCKQQSELMDKPLIIIIINVQGGVVQDVMSNLPIESHPAVVVVDWDSDAADAVDINSGTVLKTAVEAAVKIYEQKQATARILEITKDKGWNSNEDALDELVHDTAQEASLEKLNEIKQKSLQADHIDYVEACAGDLNNQGLEAQVWFLLEHGVTEETILETLEKAHAQT